MDIANIIIDIHNIKFFDVTITDAYIYKNVVFIPSPETIDHLFFDAAVKGSSKSILILTGKN